MNEIGGWIADLGITLPGRAGLIEAAVAAGLAALALGLGWMAGRRVGPWLVNQWQVRLGANGETLRPRLCAIVRHGTATILLALIANFYMWGDLAAIGLGLALGAATALTVVEILRGVNLPRALAWSVALILFAAIFSHAVGGFASTADALERIGFDVGKRRLSLWSVLTLGVTVAALYALVRLANRMVGHSIGQARGFDPTQKLLFQKLAGIVIVVAAFFFGIDLLGIDLTTFAVFSGAFGLAIGFGLQKTVGNLIAGIILLMDRSIKPGDVIVVGDSFGWVNKIGVRAVSVITRDGKEHLIPNEILMTQEVENWSYTDRNVRVRIPVPVSYDCDLKLAQTLMLQAASESPRVLDDPKPNVWLIAFGEFAIQHDILVWISDPESGVGNVKSEVLGRLWELFRENGMRVPYPQRVVTIRERSAEVDAPIVGGGSPAASGSLD